MGTMLRANELLAPDESVDSPNAQFRFTHQADGNVVLYRQRDRKPLWASNTAGQKTERLIMQGDGNLVLYVPGGRPIWASNTPGQLGNFFKLQDDGNAIVSDAAERNARWSSNTWIPQVASPSDRSRLLPGEGLYVEQDVLSPGGAYRFVHQADGNLVLYRQRDGKPLWASYTGGKTTGSLLMQGDGNLVLYAPAGRPIWDSRTPGQAGNFFKLQDDANAIVSDAAEKISRWSTNTWVTQVAPPGDRSRLRAGEGLYVEQDVLSPNTAYRLVHQADGNVVLYRQRDGLALWASNTAGKVTGSLKMQDDGNLVLYGLGENPLWASNTPGQPGNFFKLQDDANAVVSDAAEKTARWSTGTWVTQVVSVPRERARLNAGEGLYPDQDLLSPNGAYRFVHQADGNIVLYRQHDGRPLWASNTNGAVTGSLKMQDDGNLVLYGFTGRAIWASNTPGQPGNFFKLQDDANAVISDAAERTARWSTDTWIKPVPGPHRGRVRGFADLHNHQFAYLGFGGVAFHGRAYGPLDQALPWCDFDRTVEGLVPIHGGGGVGDIIGGIVKQQFYGGVFTPFTGHKVGGYPEFDGWPRWDSITHQIVHEDMLKRAVDGGLRLMVMLAVNSEYLASMTARHPLGVDDMDAVDRQLDEAYKMQDYIDEKSGGRGKGWYRIVTTPEQAEAVGELGKLAVVLGIEVDYLFRSKEPSKLTKKELTAALVKYHKKGVRHILPIHFSNNAFGGCSYDKSLQSTQFQRADGIPIASPYSLDVEKASAKLGYEYGASAPGLRNVRGLTPLGKFLVESAMDRGWIIDIDHMSNRSKADVFAIAERRHCPVVSGHTGFVEASHGEKRHEGQLTIPEVKRINRLGGMVAPIIRQGSYGEMPTFRGGPSLVPHTCGGTSETFTQAYLFAIANCPGMPVAVGTDFNGFAGTLGPRFGPDGCWGGGNKSTHVDGHVTYPFTLPGFPPMDKHTLGKRKRPFDYNTDGLAHMGMLPDLFADMLAMGLTDLDLEPLLNSAQGYVDMWRRIQKQTKKATADAARSPVSA